MVFRSSRRPVNSLKHVVDISGALVSGTVSVSPILTATTARDPANPVTVAVGSKVTSMYVSVFVLGSAGSDSGLVDWYLWRNARGQTVSGNTPDPGNTGISDVRNFIIHEEKGLAATQDGTPMVFKGVIKIPRHMQRVALNDQWQIRLLSDFAADFCIKVIYKDYQ